MKQLLPTQKQKRHIIFDLLKIEKKINIQNNIHQTVKMLFSHPKWGNIEKQKNYYRNKYCYLSQINVDIGSNGTVSPCCLASDFIQYGNIRNKTIQELWKDSAKIRKNMAEGKFYKFCYEYCNYGSIIKPMPLYLRWDLLKRQLFKRLRH